MADKGLVAALEAQGRKFLPCRWPWCRTGSRYQQEVDATVYSSVLEALRNIAKYADASHSRVELVDRDSELVFTVGDDCRGFTRRAPETGPDSRASRIASPRSVAS